MEMSFQTGLNTVILFDGWKTHDWQGIVGSMIGITLMAAIYEGLKNYREHLYVSASLARLGDRKEPSLFSGVHILQTFLQMIQIVISYFLMLIFMTYNVWLCVAIVLGGAIGYWLFAWQRISTDITECCN
ncbi:high affinity copper uptake protein 1-like [Athalia rosae]|uniref:high affinity copper uptake protein 1-like n=1 Tax=Athalia rosae TaxID=37344 RepID=UPI0006255CF3|nr:high affinity copper uptake protein 1-like [Athalia rosae]